MSMKSAEPGEKAIPHINVTPLIDVLLVLLIIFMVVTPLRPSRFKALVPEPPVHDRDIVPWDLNLRVDISKNETVQLNGEDVGTVSDTGRLSQRLEEVFELRARNRQLNPGTDEVVKTVYIKAPRSINYGRVVMILDAVKGAGATPVGLQLDQLEQ